MSDGDRCANCGHGAEWHWPQDEPLLDSNGKFKYILSGCMHPMNDKDSMTRIVDGDIILRCSCMTFEKEE